MEQPSTLLFSSSLTKDEQCEQLFQATQRQNYEQTDRLFAVLMLVQWAFAIVLSLTVSPRAWVGAKSSTHLHVYAAFFIGGIVMLLPAALAWLRPGETMTRHAIAAGQLLTSALLIHLTGGRIETHFHIFGSLAFLAFYRDWRVLLTATVVVATEHLVRGLWFPVSIFGVVTPSLFRVIEHAGYVIFEDVILLLVCTRGTREVRNMANQQVDLAAANQQVEEEKASIQRKVEEAVSEIARQKQVLNENIGEVLQAMERFAGGDLTTQLPADREGEIARLFDGFNRSVVNIKQLLQQVIAVANVTTNSSLAIKDSTEMLAKGAGAQSAQANEVAAAVTQMAQTIHQSARDTQTMAKAAENNGKFANDGKQVVKEAQGKIGQIAQVVKTSAETVGHLGASSQRIGEIINVIEDIADQTNLLALNAAIEAARAGQHGLGFAVVADEVRKLAERTNQATQQISEMIQMIQVETKTAVSDMQRGRLEVEEGLRLSASTNEALDKIVDEAGSMNDVVNLLVVSTEEQSAVASQIASNVRNISDVATTSAQEIGQIARAANELADLTDQLQALIAAFKIDGESNAQPLTQAAGAGNWVNAQPHSFVH